LRFTLTTDSNLLLELMYVRTIIEASVVADIALRRTNEDLKNISGIFDELEKAYKEKAIDKYNRLDVLFHEQIIDIADNRILSALYERLNSLLLTSFSKTGYMPGSTKESLQQHHSLLDAIRDRDDQAARALMTKHIALSTEKIKTQLRRMDHGKHNKRTVKDREKVRLSP
jgi:GntR family transcriptional regulator, galactonate operon transcriptional repressor